MSRGHHTKERRERRHRDDRYHEPRDAYPTAARGAYPEDYAREYPQQYPAEYAPPPPVYDTPAYESDYKSDYKPRRSGRDKGRDKVREKQPPLRRRGLNEDYYNPAPAPVSEEYEKPRRSRRDRGEHRARRSSEDRYDSRRYAAPLDTEDEPDYYAAAAKPRRRAKTESRGHDRGRHSRRYDDDYSEDERYDTTPEERPAKPNRTQSFLNKIGLGKADKYPEHERERGRSPIRSPSRGRRSHRAYSYSPSPPPRHRSTHGRRAKSSGEGLKRSNTQWQRAAGSAMRAGASAAYELRNDPSPWVGPKGIRVATAAIGAAMMDQMMDDRSHRSSGGVRNRAVGKLGEAALAHFVSGRSKSRGRSRKRY